MMHVPLQKREPGAILEAQEDRGTVCRENRVFINMVLAAFEYR